MGWASILISIVALITSIVRLNLEKKKSKNNNIRLLVLIKAIKRNFKAFESNFKLINFIPGKRDNEYEEPFEFKKEALEQNFSTFYDLLLSNTIISENDMLEIMECLLIIEDELYYFSNHLVETKKDFIDTNVYINPILDNIEIIERFIVEYNQELVFR